MWYRFRILILIILSSNLIHAQKAYSIEDYTGTWRWTNGHNKDTFLLVLMNEPSSLDSNLTKQLAPELLVNSLQGYHRFVQNGALVESDISAVKRRLKNKPSVFANLRNNILQIVFMDFTRNITLRGNFSIIQDSPKFAIWDVAILPERMIFEDFGLREYLPGQTIPNRIILEKIQ